MTSTPPFTPTFTPTFTPAFTPPFTHRPVDPVADLDLLHAWVTQERARFWGMTDHTREEVGEIYAYLGSLETHHAYLVHEHRDAPGSSAPRHARGAADVEAVPVPEPVEGRSPVDPVIHDSTPVAIFQTYEPEHDPVGEAYDVRPGDLGVHLFVGPGEPRPGFTGSLASYLLGVVLADPTVLRVVVEPDVLNERSRARMLRHGFEEGPVVDLGHKRAQLAFLTRDQTVNGSPVAAS